MTSYEEWTRLVNIANNLYRDANRLIPEGMSSSEEVEVKTVLVRHLANEAWEVVEMLMRMQADLGVQFGARKE